MGLPMGIAAGLLAGLVGAGVWAAIAYYANVEIGYLAWGIGALVGIAVALGSGSKGLLNGVAAVLITALSICGGKYAAVDLFLRDELAEMAAQNNERPEDIDVQVLVGALASGLVDEAEARGEEIAWPEIDEDADFEALGPEDYYPREYWAQATEQWEGMDDAERGVLREESAQAAKAAVEGFGEMMLSGARNEAFLDSFNMMDVLFFGLGIFTAWSIAGSTEDEAAPIEA